METTREQKAERTFHHTIPKHTAVFLFVSVSSVVPDLAELVTIPNRSFLFFSFSSSSDFLEIKRHSSQIFVLLPLAYPG
jgi:hypothetical protein